MVNIQRKRYVIIRNKDNAIFCGLSRSYKFVELDKLKDTPIKTYVSEKKAKVSFLQSWWNSSEEQFNDGTYKIVAVDESIKEVSESVDEE